MNAITPNPSKPARLSDRLLRSTLGAEPGLLDIAFILLSHKKIVVGFTLMGVLAGLALAFLVPPVHSYTTTIEIGSIDQSDGGAVVIEHPENVIAKLTNAYLPSLEQTQGAVLGDPDFSVGMEIRNPKGTNLIVMSSKSPADQEALHSAIHTQLGERILADHRKTFQQMLTTIGLEAETAKRQVEAVKDQIANVALRQSLLQERRNLADQRLLEVEAELKRVAANRDVAGRSLIGQEQALTLLMLDMQLAREQERRAGLQRELNIDLAEQADRLTREATELERNRMDAEGRVLAVQMKSQEIADTKLVGESQRSRQPVGLGFTMRILLAGLIGVVIGILVAMLKHALKQRALLCRDSGLA